MSNTTTTTTHLTLNVPALAQAVQMGIEFYDKGAFAPEIAALFACWDFLVDLDPDDEGDPEVLLDTIRVQVAAVLDGTATFTIKESQS